MSTPGNGDRVRVVSPTSGREWLGQVLVWNRGAPFVIDSETAAVRWYPASWVKAVIQGPPDFDPGPCICGFAELPEDGGTPYARDCPKHGDPETVASNILKRARSK